MIAKACLKCGRIYEWSESFKPEDIFNFCPYCGSELAFEVNE